MRKFIVLLLAAGALRAAEPLDLLTWRQPILGQAVSGRLYRVLLSPDVFNGCRSFPADIRITDEGKRAWPFFLWAPEPQEQMVPLFTSLGRRTSGAGGVVVQEVSVRVDDPRKPPKHNELSIILEAGHDAVRSVQVLGSADGSSWKELGSGTLVDLMQPARVNYRLVKYEETTASRLLIRIQPHRDFGEQPVDVLDVQVAWHARTPPQLQEVALAPIPIQSSEVQEGVMTLAYDAGAQNRALEHLRIRAGPGDFVLPAKVYGRNSADVPWKWVADGGLFRIGGDEKETIELKGATYRLLKIDLYQVGRKPPPIASVVAEAQPQYLVFEARGGSQPVLHYGAEKIPLPRYDLQRRTTPAAITAAPLLELGAARSNPLKVASGLSSYLKLMGIFAAIVAGCALLVFVLRFLRSRLW